MEINPMIKNQLLTLVESLVDALVMRRLTKMEAINAA